MGKSGFGEERRREDEDEDEDDGREVGRATVE